MSSGGPLMFMNMRAAVICKIAVIMRAKAVKTSDPV